MSRDRSTFRFASSLMLAGLLAGTFLVRGAGAAEHLQPQSAGSAKVAPPARPMPDLPVNAEELKAAQGKPATGEIVTRRPARVLTPMMAEVMAYCATLDEEIAARRQQLAALRTDRAAYDALQRELQQLKKNGEIEVLRIQARHAVKEGRTEDARRIEASIEERLNPKVRIVPESRPVPSSATSR